jgi:SPP1 gp7 family putative phage head morphogenesis protein
VTLDLPRLARQQGRRRNVTLRPIAPTQAMATELAAILAPAWRIWAGSVERILAGYDPAPLPTGDTLTVDSPDVIQSILNAIGADFMTRLVTEITPGLRQWTVRAERWHREKWIAAVKAGAGVDLATVLTAQPVVETLQAFLNRNVELVTNVSDQARQRIADAVYRGYQARTPAREVAKEIREAVGLARARATRIAADQNSKLSAALDMERQAEAGIAKYKWRHSGKLHPRPEHQARDGKIFALGEPASDTPGQAPFCGCRAQAYLDIMAELE